MCQKQSCNVKICPENKKHFSIQDWHRYLRDKHKCTKCLRDYDQFHNCDGRAACKYCDSNLSRLICPCRHQTNGTRNVNTRYQQQGSSSRQWASHPTPAVPQPGTSGGTSGGSGQTGQNNQLSVTSRTGRVTGKVKCNNLTLNGVDMGSLSVQEKISGLRGQMEPGVCLGWYMTQDPMELFWQETWRTCFGKKKTSNLNWSLHPRG